MIQVVVAAGVALIVGLFGTPLLIRFLRKHGYSQAIRVSSDGIQYPEHQGKKGTPSMGGLAIIIGVVLVGDLVYLATQRKLPAVCWISFVAMAMTFPSTPYAAEVAALTGKPDEHAYLQQLGATQIVDRSTLDPGSRPLETARWGGAIDNLGGTTLAWLTRTIRPFGNIACIGLAQDHRLETSVMPLILRGISLIGINSTYCPSPWRARTWERLAADLKPQHLACIVTGELTLEALPAACAAPLGGRATGRSVVRIGGG